jgi:hypothetical protein
LSNAGLKTSCCARSWRALQEAGRPDESRRYWDAAQRAERALNQVDSLIEYLKAHPSDLESRFELGMLLMKHRSREQGAGWLQSLVRLAPCHRAAHLALADFCAAPMSSSCSAVDKEAKFCDP